MPLAGGGDGFDAGREVEHVAEIAEGVGGSRRPGRPTEVEGVDPGAEGVPREGAKEALLGAVAVRDDGAAAKEALGFGPKGQEGGGIRELGGRDAVDALRRPGDGPVGVEKRAERLAVAVVWRPERDADLDRDIGLAAGGAGGLEVDRGEAGLGDGLQGAPSWADGGRDGKDWLVGCCGVQMRGGFVMALTPRRVRLEACLEW